MNIYLDAKNLWWNLMHKYGRKLDYSKYLEYASGFGEVESVVIYIAEPYTKCKPFADSLSHLGKIITCPHGMRYSPSIMMAHQIGKDGCDKIIVGSSDFFLHPVLEQIPDVLLISSRIPTNLRQYVTECVEIPESMLEERKIYDPANDGRTILSSVQSGDGSQPPCE